MSVQDQNNKDIQNLCKTRETLKPYHLVICYIALKYSESLNIEPRNLKMGRTSTTCISNYTASLASYLMTQLKADQDVVEPSFQQLCTVLCNSFNDNNGNLLVSDIHQVLRVFDLSLLHKMLSDLEAMTTNISSSVDNTGILDESVVGMFIRQCRTSLFKCSFQELYKMFIQLKCYIEDDTTQQQGGFGVLSPIQAINTNIKNESQQQSKRNIKDKYSVNNFINKSFLNIQSKVGRQAISELRQKFQVSQSLDYEMPANLYVQHILSLQERNYNLAFDQIRRYYDHSKLETNTKDGQKNDQSGFQRALFSLSSLSLHFGDIEEGIVAILESIRLCQQNGDNDTLIHSLAFLCCLLSESTHIEGLGIRNATHGGRGRQPSNAHYEQQLRLLNRLYQRSQDLHHPHLTAYSLVSIAQFGIIHSLSKSSVRSQLQGKLEAQTIKQKDNVINLNEEKNSVNDQEKQKDILKAQQASRQQDLKTNPTYTIDGAVQNLERLAYACACVCESPSMPPITQIDSNNNNQPRQINIELYTQFNEIYKPGMGLGYRCSSKKVQEHLIQAKILKGLAWSQRGSSKIEQQCYISTILLNLSDLEADNNASARKIDGDQIYQEDNTKLPINQYCTDHDSEAVMLALANLARSVADTQGYDRAIRIVNFADEEYPYHNSKSLIVTRRILYFEQAIYKNDLDRAEKELIQLTGIPHMSPQVDLSLRLCIEMKLIQLLIAQKDFDKAFHLCQQLFNVAGEAAQEMQQLELFLLMARVFYEACTPISSIPYVLSCIIQCRLATQQLIKIEAQILLAQIWLRLGPQFAKVAIQLVQGNLSIIFAYGSLKLQADAYSTLSDCILVQCDENDLDVYGEEALYYLRQASQLYNKLGYAQRVFELSVLSTQICNKLQAQII